MLQANIWGGCNRFYLCKHTPKIRRHLTLCTRQCYDVYTMNIPKPTNEQQQTKYNFLMYEIQAYRAMFPKPAPKKTPYDLKIEHDMELIEDYPPVHTETQLEYYRRVKPSLTKAWFGRVVRDMGYVRKSSRINGQVRKVWVRT